jgi:acyl carrier protein
MVRDARLDRLMTAASELSGTRINDAGVTLGDLGLDSQSLAELIAVCEDIYGDAVDMNEVTLDYEVSLRDIHLAIVRQLGHGSGESQAWSGR